MARFSPPGDLVADAVDVVVMGSAQRDRETVVVALIAGLPQRHLVLLREAVEDSSAHNCATRNLRTLHPDMHLRGWTHLDKRRQDSFG